MKTHISSGLLISIVLISLADFAAAQPGRRPGTNTRPGSDDPAAALPDDPRLMALHRTFVTDAGKLATEYERSKDWAKAKDVYQEILKLVPEYAPAQAKLNEMINRLGTAQQVLFDVHAAGSWQNTGVIVLANQPITVRAAGTWMLVAETGPDGIVLPKDVTDIKELREANLGALIGAINTGNPKEDKPFVIGAQKSFIPERNGQLFLRMHDTELRDNEGTMKVEIVGTFQQ